MITEEILSTLIVVVGFVGIIFIVYILSKIPGAGLIFGLLRRLFVLLWGVVVLALTFFMFFMVGYMAIVYFTFTGSEEGILYQGEPINFLLDDGRRESVFFTLLYAGFCLVSVYITSFFVMLGWKVTRIRSRFNAEIILVMMLLLVFTVFPMVVEEILPDIEVGRYGRYVLGILPLVMYVEGQIKRSRERSDTRYLSSKERFYRNLSEEKSNRTRK
ncbi:hypothetical protein [Oceanobacillus alkalisoli]|uniref:hypothetical protein n=1 Tax=Oceanobacillus alkalisoli TaxID=2925113 RepID=UPI001EE4E7C9|nr:hypothetical protein [Oceanobacillus alkalisoli]MCG5104218.1 hypothetical protein [Oceanobacillus alkalisoli]